MDDLAQTRLLVFRIADLAVAADVASVREVLPAQPATRIPGAHAAVAGLINVRGTLVTLVDGRRALGREGEAGAPIVLLDVDARPVGFTVDEVVDFCTVPDEDLAPREELPGVDPRFVRAVGRRADLTFVLLDIDALLGPILKS